MRCYEKITHNYRRISSTEIWTNDTIDVFLRLLVHHYEMGHFMHEESPLLLCEQLLELVNVLQEWTEKGRKGDPEASVFKLYVSNVDLENTFILMKKDGISRCIIKLFTINSLNITEERFCREVENWLNMSIQRATLISGASEKERYRFFNLLRQKIRFLIDRVQSGKSPESFSFE